MLRDMADYAARILRGYVAASVVLGAFEDPGPNILPQACRQRLVAVGHADLAAALDQHDQIAAVGLPRNDHRAEFCAFDHRVVARQIEPAGLKTLPPWLMAGDAPALHDRRDVLRVADARLLGAGRARQWRQGCAGERQTANRTGGKRQPRHSHDLPLFVSGLSRTLAQ